MKALRTLVAGILVTGMVFAAIGVQGAFASHEPANKVAAAGSDIDEVGDNTVILSETVKVSTTHDLILSMSAECSILTSLVTDDEDDPDTTEVEGPGMSAFSFGSVRLQLLIDGTPVPVASDEFTPGPRGDDEADDTEGDTDPDEPGEVTFCNRAYQRTVQDTENDEDGVDRESDFIRTRTANAFNWLALDVGVEDPANDNPFAGYDNPENGNNIVLIEVVADYDVQPAACEQSDGTPDNDPTDIGKTCAEAFVGSRTLIAEPTNASVHESVDPADPEA